ncbi:MAG: phosphatase PAP2 family protein [Candidatus Ancillula sp.]|nr:phosphatase PAP2 family protein [Candidatus Ancillula sp.]
MTKRKNVFKIKALSLLVIGALGTSVGLSSCGQSNNAESSSDLPNPTPISQVAVNTDGTVKNVGYLEGDKIMNSLDVIAEPPANGSVAKTLDETIAQNVGKDLYGGDRWLQAAIDADLASGSELANCHYDCQIGVHIDKDKTPHLYALLSRLHQTADDSGNYAKKYYNRLRPFKQGQAKNFGINTDKTCRPDMETSLIKGSYPSGHTTVGWLEGLVLATIDPSHQNAIMARAQEYSESRVVCNHHWYSDVDASRALAGAIYASLQQSDQYLADLKAAKEEFSKVLADGSSPANDKKYTLKEDSTATTEEDADFQKVAQAISGWNCDKENTILEQNLSSIFARGNYTAEQKDEQKDDSSSGKSGY